MDKVIEAKITQVLSEFSNSANNDSTRQKIKSKLRGILRDEYCYVQCDGALNNPDVVKKGELIVSIIDPKDKEYIVTLKNKKVKFTEMKGK